MNRDLAFIGAGTVGTALAVLLKEKGWKVSSVYSRTEQSMGRFSRFTGTPSSLSLRDTVEKGKLIFITVPDRTITSIVEEICKHHMDLSGKEFFHCSGSLASNVLTPLRDKGGLVGSLHPLQAFSDVEGAKHNLPGSLFAFEGDERLREVARRIVDDVGGHFAPLATEGKALYHAAACIISNYTVTLAHAAFTIYKAIGFTPDQTKQALLPLLEGTINNLRNASPAQALTGPISRGDGSTLSLHLLHLEGLDPNITSLYEMLGNYTVDLSLEKGSVSPEEALVMRKILQGRLNDCVNESY